MTQDEYNKTRAELRQRSIAALKKVVEKSRKVGMHELADSVEAELPKLGAGDVVAAITSAVGIEPCDDCEKRKAAMNKVDLGAPIFEVVKGLARAVFKPQ